MAGDPNTATVDGFTKVYDGLVYSGFTVRYAGFVNGETSSVLSGSLSFSGAGTTQVNAGDPYTVTPGGLTSSNYAITFGPGSLTINARGITVTAAANTKVYDASISAGAIPTITSSYPMALVGSDTPSFTETYDNKNVGTYKTLTPAGSVNDGNSGNNYAVSFVATTNGTINARGITVTAAANTKAYDGMTSPAAIPSITNGTLGVGDIANFSETYADPSPRVCSMASGPGFA